MTTTKIAISLPGATYRRAKNAVRRGRAASMSAYVAAALEQKATFDELDDMLDEMLAESGGPMTEAERARIDQLFAEPKLPKRPAKR